MQDSLDLQSSAETSTPVANQNRFVSRVIFSVVALIIFGILFFSSVFTIDAGTRGLILTFGNVTRTVDSGLHFKIPFIQTLKLYNVRVQKATFGAQEGQRNQRVLSAYSFDQQIIESYRISITYQYDATKLVELYQSFGMGDDTGIFSTVVSPIVQQVTKVIFGQFTAQTIVQERAKLEEAIDTNLKAKLARYPVSILSIQLEDVNFSKSYEATIEQTAEKKMEIEKAKNELQKIEIESQQQVAQAEAKSAALKLETDARAYQIGVQAKAEAEAKSAALKLETDARAYQIGVQAKAEADARAYQVKAEADARKYKIQTEADARAHEIGVVAKAETEEIKMKSAALKGNKEFIDLIKAKRWNGATPRTVLGGGATPLINLSDEAQ